VIGKYFSTHMSDIHFIFPINPKNAIDGRHMCSTFVSALMIWITCTFSFSAFNILYRSKFCVQEVLMHMCLPSFYPNAFFRLMYFSQNKGDMKRSKSGLCCFNKLHGDDFGSARVFHGYSIYIISHVHSISVMGYYNELGVF